MTVTYPFPACRAMATATLDAKNMPERIEVKDGNTVTEFTTRTTPTSTTR